MTPRKRQRKEKETSSTQSSPASSVAPKINQEDGTITFSLSTVHDYLICELCDGYYRDPYTITDCLHTFCKSCLFCAVECGCYECPSPGCKVYLGKDPLRMVEERNAVSDRGLQEFIDRIVFPDIVEQEQEEEKKFYEQQQNNKTSRKSPPQEAMMKRKSETIPSQSSLSFSSPSSLSSHDIQFTLLPDLLSDPKTKRNTNNNNVDVPPLLQHPCLKISGQFRIAQVKKYCKETLGMDNNTNLDILCNGVTLGDEMNLSAVKRLLWHQDSDMALLYKYAQENNT